MKELPDNSTTISTEEYQNIFEAASDGILIIELETHKFKLANKAIASMLGYEINEIFNLSINDLHLEESFSFNLERFGQYGRQRSFLSQDLPLRKKDGSVIYADVNTTLVDFLGKECLLCIYRDTTYLHKLQTLTIETEAKYASILRVAPIGIGLVFNRIITLASDRLCEIAGYSRQELLGQDARIVYPDDEEYLKVGRQIYSDMRKFGVGAIDTRWKRKDGKIIDIDLRFTPIYSDDFSAGITFTALDITKRRQVEEREEFLLTLLSHDLKNKMHIINGYLKLLSNTGLSDKQLTMVNKALGACDASNKLIEKVVMLRGIGRKEEIQQVSIEPLITAAVGRVYDKAIEEKITINLDPISGNVIGGPLLEECFYNILENSVKHAKCSEIRITHTKLKNRLKIIFEDDGHGIHQEILKNIFIRGVKGEHSNGLGLGNFLVYQIIINYGGTIKVSSSSIGGAKFTIYLKRGFRNSN
ncbi:MAG: PAS domain S-box protein [Candidatus Hodarchaeales archaeon]